MTPRLRFAVLLSTFAGLAGLSFTPALERPAFAETEKQVCLDAMSKGQTLRDAHKLIEARDRFRVCARQVCPAMVQQDCGGWLGELERSVPTVVVSARSNTGVDLVAVKVSLDGQPFLASLSGEATATNPGLHTFRFEAEGMVPSERQVLVKEGGKDQQVAAVMTLVAPPPMVKPPVAPEPAPPPPETSSGSAVRTVGWVLASVGAAGVVGGAVAGAVAIQDKSSHCDASNVCQPTTLQPIKTAALLSDIGLIAGGALLAGGIGMVLFAPKHHAAPAAGLHVVPVFTGNAGGLTLGSSF